MKLKQLLEQLNQLAKERPEALEMEVWVETCCELQMVDNQDPLRITKDHDINNYLIISSDGELR